MIARLPSPGLFRSPFVRGLGGDSDLVGGTIEVVTQEANDLLKKALTLPAEERAALASSLIESLDTTIDKSSEAAWSEEIVRRIEQLDSGEAKTVPWEDVRRQISAKLTNGQ